MIRTGVAGAGLVKSGLVGAGLVKSGLVGAIVLLAGLGLWLRDVPDWGFVVPQGAKLGTGARFETVFRHTSSEGTAHAPAIDPDGAGFDLLWFDGLRESHNDVRILRGDVATGEVSEELTRQGLSARMLPPQTVLTLGNPLAGQAHDFVTVVSLGGWAASSVVADDGRLARKLSLSPVLNRSHLVKSPLMQMGGGFTLLPTYYEMGAAYGAVALLDARGRVRAQSLMTGGAKAIQPMVVALSETDAVALLRSFERAQPFIMASWSRDGGRSWSRPEALDLPNPSAPVAAVRLEDGRLLMLFNDDAQDAGTLSFAVSGDQGRTWARTRVLDGPGDLRYPMMKVLESGDIAVTYSQGTKAEIVAHVLNADWAVSP